MSALECLFLHGFLYLSITSKRRGLFICSTILFLFMQEHIAVIRPRLEFIIKALQGYVRLVIMLYNDDPRNGLRK